MCVPVRVLRNILLVISLSCFIGVEVKNNSKICREVEVCSHSGVRECGLEERSSEIRWFLDVCDIMEFNCEYGRLIVMICYVASLVDAHGPPLDRDKEDIAMGKKVKKMGAKWCGMAKVCNHDHVPVCGVNHAGEVMGFRDLCDMFDFNCIRRRNFKQTACPDDRNLLTVSRRPTSAYYED